MADVHDLPTTDSGGRIHTLDRACWCRPKERRQPSGDVLIVHDEETRA